MKITNFKLEDLATISAGGTPKRSETTFWNGGEIPWVKIKDIKGKYVTETEEKITELGLEKSSAKLFPKGTILYTIFATLGECAILDIDATTNQAIAGIKVKSDQVLSDYLYYYLKSIKGEVINQGRGVAQNNINLKILRNIIVPVPSIENQKNIIKILQETESVIDRRKQQIKALSALKQSVFLDMFGDPIYNPHNWETRTLPNLVIDDKHSLKRGPFGGSLKKEIFVDSGYLVYEQYHAINDDYDFGRYFIDEKKYEEMSAFKIESGDLLISCSGTIGRISEVPPGAKEGIINQALLKLTLDNEIVLNEYFIQLFLTNSMQNNLFGLSKGSGIKNFPSMKVMKQIKFIIPSLELQQKYVEKIHAIEGRLETLNKSYNEMKLLYNSLLHKAFNGELFKEDIRA